LLSMSGHGALAEAGRGGRFLHLCPLATFQRQPGRCTTTKVGGAAALSSRAVGQLFLVNRRLVGPPSAHTQAGQESCCDQRPSKAPKGQDSSGAGCIWYAVRHCMYLAAGRWPAALRPWWCWVCTCYAFQHPRAYHWSLRLTPLAVRSNFGSSLPMGKASILLRYGVHSTYKGLGCPSGMT
jgi:hypothetical protein